MESKKAKDQTCWQKFLDWLKQRTFGKLNVGMYYQKNQSFLTKISIILSVFGAIGFLIIIVWVCNQVFTYQQVTTKFNVIDSAQNNIIDFDEKVSVQNFQQKSKVSFKIKAYNFDYLIHEPLACNNVQLSIFYNVPTTKDNTRIPVSTQCRELNGALNYTIQLNSSPQTQQLYLENSQYLSVDVNYTGKPFILDGTKLYFYYSGQNFYFSDLQNIPVWFNSLDLEFGKFYKTQIAPYFTSERNLWFWPFDRITRNYVFTFQEPYFSDTQKRYGSTVMRIFFKFTNDNNPFDEAYIVPQSVLDGISKIGGFFILIKLLDLALGAFNQKKFEKSLKEKYIQIASEQHKDEEAAGQPKLLKENETEQTISLNTIKETVSYENLMKLTLGFKQIKETQKKGVAINSDYNLQTSNQDLESQI